MIHIYTGNGKGKTTAALGQAMRAIGHGLKVLMIQFMKGKINYGELEAAKKLPNFTIEQFGRPDFVNPENPDEEDIRLARAGLARASEAVDSRKYDIVILDEINVAANFGLIESADIIALFKRKSADVTLILTGRYMPEELEPYADLITECREVRHYFNKGTKAREGFEY
ncbi:MAG: cob(I)yrinic acid a,c-diamide adenosyltransferase [candidate division WOR-3 bacterium]|nr:MAG: cob(I)yrinic acid a,c-diamide adenosyltransferase [candidate division WOR-3 bacterium]